MITPRPQIGIFTILLISSVLISCSGDYPVVENGSCDLDKFQSEIDREVGPAVLSMVLVKRLKNGEPTSDITECLEDISLEKLNQQLNTEAKKKAFWINMYNAYIQILLTESPELFEDRNSWFGYNFFSTPQVVIAGRKMSFDDMEHGIMRRSTIKISLGYLQNWFVDDVEELLMWDEIDPRIHFALNCGAASCPPVAAFDPAHVNEQLDTIARKHLESKTEYLPQEEVVKTTKLMSWFRGDFGGKKGAKQLLKDYGIIPSDASPSIEFNDYDWTLDLDNYQEI